eukprot:3589222-Alexandrium_andersonii.AAC.1
MGPLAGPPPRSPPSQVAAAVQSGRFDLCPRAWELIGDLRNHGQWPAPRTKKGCVEGACMHQHLLRS